MRGSDQWRGRLGRHWGRYRHVEEAVEWTESRWAVQQRRSRNLTLFLLDSQVGNPSRRFSTNPPSSPSTAQLRDLLTFTPDSSSPFSEGGNSNTAVTVCYDSLCSIDLWSRRPPDYTPLKFTPAVVTSGLGLVAAGGQSSEIALKSAQAGSDWCVFSSSPSSEPSRWHRRRSDELRAPVQVSSIPPSNVKPLFLRRPHPPHRLDKQQHPHLALPCVPLDAPPPRKQQRRKDRGVRRSRASTELSGGATATGEKEEGRVECR